MSPMWRDLVWLQSALRDMTERERTMFVMSELEGQSRTKIAATFLISIEEVEESIQSAYEYFERGWRLERGSADSWAVGHPGDN